MKAREEMSYAERKRRNEAEQRKRLAKMKENQEAHEKEAWRRQKLREARDRKAARAKAEADAVEAEKERLEALEEARVKLPPGIPADPKVDDTLNLYMYDGQCVRIPWDTAPAPLVATAGDLLQAVAGEMKCAALPDACGIYVDTEPMDTWSRRGPLPLDKRLESLFIEWRAGNPAEKLRQAQERKTHAELKIQANEMQILERNDNLIDMEAYADEAELMVEKTASAFRSSFCV